MFNCTKFKVDLSIERVTRIPYSAGSMFVRWNVTDSPRPDAHGRTKSGNISNTEAHFKYQTNFNQRIRLATPSKTLKSCEIKFEVVWEPVGGRGVTIGTLRLDLAQYTKAFKDRNHSDSSKHSDESHSNTHNSEHHSSGKKHSNDHKDLLQQGHVHDRSLLYLLEGARNNCLLEVRIAIDYVTGDADYRVPEFDGPAINYDLHQEPVLEDGALEDDSAGNQRSRDRLRNLKRSVFRNLLAEDQMHGRHNDAECEWLDFDKFLQGHSPRLISSDLEEEFKKYGIRDNSELSYDDHARGTPYLESEIRDNFVNWNVMGS